MIAPKFVFCRMRPGPPNSYAPVPHGFATLIEKEQSLGRLIEMCRARAGGRHNRNLVRTLSQHLDLVDSILALLRKRRGLLPRQERFQVPPPASRPLTHRLLPAGTDGPATLPNLLNWHLDLRQELERLLFVGRATDREPLLREAAQRHDEMAWMLTALINEDREIAGGRPRFLSSSALRPALPAAEDRWENEGGTTLPELVTTAWIPLRPY